MGVPAVGRPDNLVRRIGQVLRPPAVGGVAQHKAAAALHERKVVCRRALRQYGGRQAGRGQVFARPGLVVGKDKELGLRFGGGDGRDGGCVILRRADLQNLVFGLEVIPAAQVYGHRPARRRNRRGKGAGWRCFGAQLAADRTGCIGEVPLALEVAPAEKIPTGAAAGRGVAVGGKVQADHIEQRGHAALKRLPVARQQAAALLVLNHQRLGGVLAGQVGFGELRLAQDPHPGADGQRFKRTGRVGGRAVAPVLPVKQGDPLAASQTERAGKRIDKHLVAKAAGQFRIDHRAPANSS